MKKIKYSLILLLLVALCSCKKQEYPESKVEGSSDFYFKATINGSPISINAGVNNYYMYSSYEKDVNNVYNFIADLRQTDCSNCVDRLQIKINDFKTSGVNEPAQINQALAPQTYPIIAGSTFYSVQFQSMYNKTASTYLWDFGDGTTSNVAAPVHNFSRSGKFNVSLTISDQGSCVSSISNIQKIGYPVGCTALIAATATAPNAFLFSANAQGTGPFNYLWNFGDGSTSTLANPTHSYSIIGAYPVQLRVIDTGINDTAYVKYNAVTQSDQSSCAANYSITAAPVPVVPFSGITITWTDAAGKVFTSDNSLQPGSNYFEVLSVEDYFDNEKGEKTKKITIKFKCMLYNGTNTKVVENAEATISVSYK